MKLYIPIGDLEAGRVYILAARTLRYGVWTGDRFVGIATDAGQRFLAEAFHCDPPYGGDARPISATRAVVPNDVDLTVLAPLECPRRRTPVDVVREPDRFAGGMLVVGRFVGWQHTDDGSPCKHVWANRRQRQNQPLFDWLDKLSMPPVALDDAARLIGQWLRDEIDAPQITVNRDWGGIDDGS